MSEPLRLVAATANAHKLEEMAAIFGDAIELLPRPAELGEVVEDADTFVGNARLKATAVCEATGAAAIADDSGLEVDALGGEPGVQSAYYAGGDHDHEANCELVLQRLGDRLPEDRAARFRTVLVARWPDGREVVAEGTCEGTIGFSSEGTNGFGYDPIFLPAWGGGRTFGQMSAEQKNELSHRNRACHALLEALAESGD